MQLAIPNRPVREARFREVLRDLSSRYCEDSVLSVYLDLDPATAGREGYEAQLLGLWKPLHDRQWDRWGRGRLEYEIAGVTEAVRSWDEAPGRAVAMFFSGPAGLRAVHPLPVAVPPLARFERWPVLAPLVEAASEHRRYGVVVFDKEHARIITVFLDGVEEETLLHANVLGRSEAGGWSQASHARHREQQLREHARRVTDHLREIDHETPLHSLILSGPDEALAVLRGELPEHLARGVSGTAHIEMFAVTADVAKHVALIDQAARAREERELVLELLTDASKGRRAALGWDETLQSLAEGRVHMLVVPAGVTRSGVQCPERHFLSTQSRLYCPLCQERLWQTDDIIEAALRVATATDADVRFVSSESRRLLPESAPAAVLRY